MVIRWKEFRPADGVMRAEGNGHLMTSTLVRSLGVMSHYSITRKRKPTRYEETYIPSSESDAMGFGVISAYGPSRGFGFFRLPQLLVGTQQEIVISLTELDDSGISASILRKFGRGSQEKARTIYFKMI